ncbi:uncharacterized protein LOC132295163 isoform X2 [Cornus florida]|uniref:uncharacterized protein LOC132295163 isoform X2 n=1 Tax=Cornus florida TaxID=4283 RepID=UPI00289A3370|nr:uncharacterized protein LOC132295163 isoform X2 [Cornus florida]
MAVASFRLWPSPPPSSWLLGTSKPPPEPRSSHCCCSPKLSLSSTDKTLREIKNSGIIACLRAQSSELAIEAARAALSGGISVLEIVMSTPGVFEVLQQLVQDHPTTVLGVGTVLNTKDANNAINAGAKFLMSPAMVKGIVDDIQGGDILYIPGAMTPTEILSAYNAGSKIVKDVCVPLLLNCSFSTHRRHTMGEGHESFMFIPFLHQVASSIYQHSTSHFLISQWLLLKAYK